MWRSTKHPSTSEATTWSGAMSTTIKSFNQKNYKMYTPVTVYTHTYLILLLGTESNRTIPHTHLSTKGKKKDVHTSDPYYEPTIVMDLNLHIMAKLQIGISYRHIAHTLFS